MKNILLLLLLFNTLLLGDTEYKLKTIIKAEIRDCPVWACDTIKKVKKNKILKSNKLKDGSYYINKYKGWLDSDSVKIISKINIDERLAKERKIRLAKEKKAKLEKERKIRLAKKKKAKLEKERKIRLAKEKKAKLEKEKKVKLEKEKKAKLEKEKKVKLEQEKKAKLEKEMNSFSIFTILSLIIISIISIIIIFAKILVMIKNRKFRSKI